MSTVNFDTKSIKATRKLHRCFGCWKIIPIGSEAVYAAGVWEGEFYANHWHKHCNAFFLTIDSSEEGIGPGELLDIKGYNEFIENYNSQTNESRDIPNCPH